MYLDSSQYKREQTLNIGGDFPTGKSPGNTLFVGVDACDVSGGCSPTAALGDDHSVVLVLVRDRALVVDVQDRDGVEPGRHAARPAGFARVVGVQDRLHDGVFRRREVVAEREITPTRAFVRLHTAHVAHIPR